ncbi:hypothetical protein [Candidatus Synechococcus spongiarum]|uniref:Uncharacterized protein n=1 Tax=Candidatus Synechococcus spongiarum TaxID=431041 RepID=A0A164Y432_9SYNE|nr:hypothetical protein [Candidatus Synechococcus spongiarum]SAY38939.1 hypothetical protein FLM9_961 [Candidatus Synechococcus spongiarum]
MDHPTPLQRLATLEGNVARLEQQQTTPPPAPSQADTSKRRLPQWTGDSLLLAQLQRRHPEALQAYEQPADLAMNKNGRVSLAIDKAAAPFVFVVTPPDGDALLYPAADPPDWLLEGSLIRGLFALPGDPHGLPLKLERPARFIAARQGEEWVFHSQGELVPTVASRRQAEEKRRQQERWEELIRRQQQQAIDLKALKEQVAVLDRALQRLCRIQNAVARTTPQEP